MQRIGLITRRIHFAIPALIGVGLILSLAVGAGELKAQSAPGGELIFTTGQLNAKGIPGSHNVLARLNLGMARAISWYSDPSAAYLKALSWSPQGDLMAFLRVDFDGKSYSAQLCLLNQAGVRQRCFDDRPVGYSSTYNDTLVTWSEDGTHLFFVSGDFKIRRLVEAQVSTGKTQRIIYTYNLQDNELEYPPVLAWTNDLTYLTIGAGDHTRVQQGMPVLLLDIKTQQRIDLAHITGAAGSSPFVVCPYFSPHGIYLTAYNFDVPETPASPQFLILDTQGKIKTIVKPSAPFNALPQSCPAWQKDEQAFYFDAWQVAQQSSTLRVFKYMLQSRQFALTFQSGKLSDPGEAMVNSRLRLSSDETSLAFESPYDPGVRLGTQVVVITLSGTLNRYSAPFAFSSDPLWIPQTTQIF